MSATMRQGRRNARRARDPISNRYVELDGRRYRVCCYNGRVIMVDWRRKPGGLARALDPQGRRARRIIHAAACVAIAAGLAGEAGA